MAAMSASPPPAPTPAPPPADGYTGQLSPDAPTQHRNVPGLRITKTSVGTMDNNAYLLECARTGALCLIDAASEPDRLLALLGGRPLSLVVTTHQHADHWQALAEVVAATGARTAAGRADAEALPVPPDELLDDGDTVAFGEVRLDAVRLRGHTPGSVALIYRGDPDRPHVWTGDSLFPGGVGNTFGDRARFAQLLDDVTAKLFDRLPDQAWVYPGHGADTTLGAERSELPEWRRRGW